MSSWPEKRDPKKIDHSLCGVYCDCETEVREWNSAIDYCRSAVLEGCSIPIMARIIHKAVPKCGWGESAEKAAQAIHKHIEQIVKEEE